MKYTLELTEDEALVLFEYLTRTDKTGTLTFEDPAEQSVLWLLEAALEEQLVAPLRPDYTALLNRARKEVRKRWGPA